MKNPLDGGSALLGVLAVILMAGTVVAVASRMSQVAVQGSGNEQAFTEALYFAESGLEAARYNITKGQRCATANIATVSSGIIGGRGEFEYSVAYDPTITLPLAPRGTWRITSTGYAPSKANAAGKQVLKWEITGCYTNCPTGDVFPTVTYPPANDITLGADSPLNPSATMIYDRVEFANTHSILTASTSASRYDVRAIDMNASAATFNVRGGVLPTPSNYYIKEYDMVDCGGAAGGGLDVRVIASSGKANLIFNNLCVKQNNDFNAALCDSTTSQNLTIYVYGTATFKSNTEICGLIRGCGPSATLNFANGSQNVQGGIAGTWANGSYNETTDTVTGLNINASEVMPYAAVYSAEFGASGQQYTTFASNWKACYITSDCP